MEKFPSNDFNWRSGAIGFQHRLTVHYSDPIPSTQGEITQLSLYDGISKYIVTDKKIFIITIDNLLSTSKQVKFKSCIVVVKLKGRITSIDYVFHNDVPSRAVSALHRGYTGDKGLYLDENGHLIDKSNIVEACLHQFDILWSPE